MTEPFVSVVTPFYNTAPYLAQCIESVLAQTYRNFEYLLVDNCSTDGSGEIAESFARRDGRIRVVRQPSFLSQVQNYNSAIDQISPQSRYLKLVQADDFIFPDCLRSMVQLLEQHEAVGLVSSYWLKGDEVRGSGFPHEKSVLPGREMARLYLRTGLWVFASPTTVMYRSSLIKKGQPFYDESQLHEDTQKCMEIVKDWDFGFVHQVLSFSRVENESISSAVRGFHPEKLDGYITVKRQAPIFLGEDEAAMLTKQYKQTYYRVLAHEVLRGREAAFWQYHTRGLSTIGEKLDRGSLAIEAGRELLWKVGNPLATIAAAFAKLKRKMTARRSAGKLHSATENAVAPDAVATPAAKN